MSVRRDLNDPFNEETNDIRFAVEVNIQKAMYSLDKERINGKWVATDLEQIRRRVKLAVALGLSGHRLLSVNELISLDRTKQQGKMTNG